MQTTYLYSLPYTKRIRPLLTVQFLGIFNSCAFLTLTLLTLSGTLFGNAAAVLTAVAVCVLPFLLIAPFAGAAADKFQKRTVIVIAAILEFFLMIAGAISLSNAERWGIIPLFCVAFLLISKTAYFSPAYLSILAETFQNRELSKANGDAGTITLAASAAGVCGASILLTIGNMLSKTLAENYPAAPLFSGLFLAGIALLFLSVLQFFFSLEIQPTAEYEDSFRREKNLNILNSLWLGLSALFRRKSILFAALGDAFFLGIAIAIPFLLAVFVSKQLPVNGGIFELLMMELFPAAGMAFGCCCAGRVSFGKIELGLVPYGGITVAIFLPLAANCPGGDIAMYGYLFHPLALIYLALAGIGAGFFIIPLRAFLLQAVRPEARGAAMACVNAIRSVFLCVSAVLTFAVVTGTTKIPADAPEFVRDAARQIPAFDVAQLMTWIGIVSLIVTIFSILGFPDLFIRAGVLLMAHTLYKIKVLGIENVPERGPVLLVANHASLVDSLLITYCCSRKIRFLMHEDYYNLPLVKPFAKMTRAIMVPAGRHVKKMQEMLDETKKALAEGYAVCIFPEGKITRSGLINDFKAGYSMMIPEDLDVPIVPVYIGLIWGSIFSYYYGKIKPRMPRGIPYPAVLNFGKPTRQPVTAFQMRQRVAELGAECEMAPRDNERTLHYQLAKNAMRHPFHTIITDYSTGKTFNNFQMLVASILFSREIRRMMPDSTKYVGVMMPNMSVSAIAIMGVIMADKVPAPLNFTASPETLKKSIEKAGITHILTSRKFLAKIKREPIPEMVFLEDLAPKIPKWKKFMWAAAAILLRHQELMNFVSPLTHRNLSAPGVLLFSSGSTGDPKGVLLSHRNINGDIYSFLRVMGFTTNDKILGSLPLFHSFGFTTAFWMHILVGSSVVYVTSPLDTIAVGSAVEKYKLTVLLATPTFIQSYIRRCKPEQFASLRLAIVGAEKLRHDIVQKFGEITGGRIALVEGYGCTELAPIVSINVGKEILKLGQTIGKDGSIGVAMPGICVKIVDPVTREELPADTDGLMLVKGANVMMGYLNDPVQTNRVISEDGWYETGDIASMDVDGYITISGRLSRFSKIAGEMVPHEMIECILNELSGSEDRIFAVGGIPDPAKGEALLVLYRKDYPLNPDEMNAKLREKNLPNLWIPRTANYKPVDELPILGNGKLDLLKLAETIREYV